MNLVVYKSLIKQLAQNIFSGQFTNIDAKVVSYRL